MLIFFDETFRVYERNPAGNDVTFTAAGMIHRLDLMLVEKKWFSALIAENLRRFRQNNAASGEVIHGCNAGVGRIWSSASGHSRASSSNS